MSKYNSKRDIDYLDIAYLYNDEQDKCENCGYTLEKSTDYVEWWGSTVPMETWHCPHCS